MSTREGGYILSEDLYATLAKLRDNFNGAAMALDEFIQQKSKAVLQTYDVEKIKWEDRTGEKGAYQATEDANNSEYKALREDLQKHEGKMNIKGMFYWVFQNGTTIGRKHVGNRS